jgi:hypothetical protein
VGVPYAYDESGNGGPPILTELAWGASGATAGRLGIPAPLFPRLEVESDLG